MNPQQHMTPKWLEALRKPPTVIERDNQSLVSFKVYCNPDNRRSVVLENGDTVALTKPNGDSIYITIYANILILRTDNYKGSLLEYFTFNILKNFDFLVKFYPIGALINKITSSAQNKYDTAIDDERVAKSVYLTNIQNRISAEAILNSTINTSGRILNDIAKLNYEVINSSLLHLKLNDVTCSDVQGVGDDIDLGDLTFSIDILDKNLWILDGEHGREGYSGNVVYHPHQLNNTLCTGTLEPDVNKALSEYDFAALKIIISKFAETYNSEDDAGKYWRAWTDEGMIEMVYVPSHGEEFPENDTYYSRCMDQNILQEDAVTLECDDYCHIDYATSIDDEWYYIDDYAVARLGSGDYALRENVEWSEMNQEYMLKDEAKFIPEEDSTDNYGGWVTLEQYEEWEVEIKKIREEEAKAKVEADILAETQSETSDDQSSESEAVEESEGMTITF